MFFLVIAVSFSHRKLISPVSKKSLKTKKEYDLLVGALYRDKSNSWPVVCSVVILSSSAVCCECRTQERAHTLTEFQVPCLISVGYTRPTLASPMAPHTSKTNSSGKAKSPKVSSRASANSSGFFLSFPSSTMVAAGRETETGK